MFTVGFIGGIRYLKQMKMLVDAAEIVGCNVLFIIRYQMYWLYKVQNTSTFNSTSGLLIS